MNRNIAKKLLLACGVGAAFVSVAQGQTFNVSWIGAASGLYGTASNWSTSVVPDNNVGLLDYFNVTINRIGGAAVTGNFDPSILNLTIATGGNQLLMGDARQLELIGTSTGGAATLSNAGTLNLGSTVAATATLMLSGSSTNITGGGTIGMFGDCVVSGGGTVTSNNTFIGAGNLGNDLIALINNGTVSASGGSLTVDGRPSVGVDNNGLMQALPGGTLVLTGNGGGVVFNAGGSIVANGISGSNARVQLVDGVTISGGTLSTNSFGLVFMPSNNNGTLVNVTNNADISINPFGNTLNFLGTITNNNRIRTNNSAGVATYNIGSSTVTLNGTGSLILSQLSTAAGNLVGSGTLVNGANHRIFGAGTIGDGSTTIRNDGLIEASLAGQVLNVRANVIGLAIFNNGIFRAGAGELKIHNPVQMTNTGTLDVVSGGVMTFDVSTENSAVFCQGGTIAIASGGRLRSVGSTGLVFLQSATLTNSGTVDINDCIWELTNCSFVNNGTINVFADAPIRLFNATTTTVTGNGKIVLDNALLGTVSGQATFNNAGSTISGFGDIGNNALAIFNAGTISANVASTSLRIDGGAGGVTNTGTLQATNGGVLFLDGDPVVTNAAGTLLANNGVIALGDGLILSGGTLVSSGTGNIQIGTADLVALNGVTVTGGSEVRADAASTTTFFGTINNNGTIAPVTGAATSGTFQTGAGATVFNGNGTLRIGATGGAPWTFAGTGTLVNGALHTIAGHGSLGANTLAIINSGTIQAQNSNSPGLTINPGAGNLINNGTITDSAGGILTVSGAGVGTLDNSNGTFTSRGGNPIRFTSGVISGGTLNSSGGAGFFVVAGGFVTLENVFNSTLISGGGAATIIPNGTMTNNGTIAVGGGDPQGVDLLINGTVTLNGNGAVRLIDGVDPGTILGIGTLINASNTIRGAGIFGNNAISIRNSGLISADVATGSLIVDPGAGAWTNSGTMQATGGAILRLDGVGGGALLGNTGGTIRALDASTVTLNSVRVNGGSLTTAGSGVINISTAASATLENLTNAGLFGVGTNSALIISGVVNNSGTMSLALTNTLPGGMEILTASTFNNSGTFVGDGSAAQNTRIEGDGTINNTGVIRGAMTFINPSGSTLFINNSGLIRADDTSITVGGGGGPIALSNTGSLHVVTGSAMTVNAVSTVSGNGAIQVDTGANFANISHSFTAGAVLNNGSFLNFGSAALGGVSGVGTFGTGLVAVGTIGFTHLRNHTIVNNAGLMRTCAGGGTLGTSRAIGTLSIDTTDARWDLTNHDLVVDYTVASPISTIQGYIATGFAGGAWTGNGLTSSSAAAASATPDRTGLGYAEAGELFGGFPAQFSGQTIDSTTVLVKYTLLGDANLDGTVDIGDFASLSANFNTTGRWNRGDFNYDSLIDIGDFAFLASNFNKVLPVDMPRGASVPEPATASALLVLTCAMGRRRRAHV